MKSWYDNIFECPIRSYQLCEETKDYKYLLRDQSEKSDNLESIFIELTSQIIDEFGIPEISQLIFYKQKELTGLNLKWIIIGEDWILNEIRRSEDKLLIYKKRADSGKKEDLKKLHATNHRIVSKWSGRDSRLLTIFEYYNDLKDLEKETDAKADNIRKTNKS